MDHTKTHPGLISTHNSDRMLLYASVLLGAFLRLYRLGHQSIWGDEALTLQVYTVGSSLGDLLSRIWERGFHPPFYFILAHYWYKLGTSEFMLRFPSAVFGIATVPIIYLIAKRLFGSRVGVISAFVVALSPFHIWYSQEARMYSLQILLVAASFLFLLKAFDALRARDFAAYGLAVLLGLFTHMGTALMLPGHGLFALDASVKDRRRFLVLLVVQVLVVVAFVPWVLNFAEANKGIGTEGAIGFDREKSIVHVAYALYTLSVGYSLGPSVAELHYESPREAVAQHMPVIGASALVFGLLVLIGFRYAYSANRFGFWLLTTGFLVPVGLVCVASLMPGVPLNPRYVTVAIVPFWIVLAMGISACAARPVWRPLAAGLVLLVVGSVYNHYFIPAYSKQDLRSAVRFVNQRAKSRDVILISSIEIGGPFIYYFRQDGVPYYGYPPKPGLIEASSMDADLKPLLGQHRRVWLILGRTWSSDPDGVLPRAFQAACPVVEARRYHGVEVKCFVLSRQSILPPTKPILANHY